MKQLFSCLLIVLMLSNCASIVSGRTQNISVNTQQVEAAKCSLANNKGTWYVNQTPGSVTINGSSKDLRVSCEKRGYNKAEKNVDSSVKAWIFGNILFGLIGGPIGVAVDMVNGAGYKYPQEVSVPMASSMVSRGEASEGLINSRYENNSGM